MKKRVLAGILMMVFVLASVMGVSAANSATADVTIVEKSKGYYIVRTGADQFVDDKGTYEDTSDDEEISVKADIDAYNAGTKTLAQLLTNYSNVAKELEGKQALTTIIDLHDVNGGQPEGGKHYVTVKVPTLTDKCSDVKVLHYSVKDSKWEIVESKVDVAKQIVTVISDDLSPIAIFAKVSTGSGATGTSPTTEGTSSTWMLWTAAALIVLGAGVVATKKRSHS